jgi:hypothetical protein
MNSCTLKKIRIAALSVGLIVWWGWPRNTHDNTIVDGRVQTMSGAPVAGAIVRVGFPITENGGGDADTTDADGCFHLFTKHSSRDRNVFLSVRHADFAHWERKRRDAFMITAMVLLDTNGATSTGGGWVRPRESRDTALPPCREKPTRVAAAP